MVSIGRFRRWGRAIGRVCRRTEVFVQSFPPSGGKWQISTFGGSEPQWRRDGKELFYMDGNKLMAVDVKTDLAGFEGGIPKQLVRSTHFWSARPQPLRACCQRPALPHDWDERTDLHCPHQYRPQPAGRTAAMSLSTGAASDPRPLPPQRCWLGWVSCSTSAMGV